MAEVTQERRPPSSLICPMCLDVFEGATLLTCGHTFCRKCLEKYDASHQDLDHIVCPLCRTHNNLEKNRIQGLPANVTVNGLVDDFTSSRGGLNAILESNVMGCTACESSKDSVAYCKTCNNYMCEHCLGGHQQLTSFFKGHHIMSMQEIESGATSISKDLEKCSEHRLENKDMFCEDCQIYICFKCVIVGHREHKIRSQKDFKQEIRRKVDGLLQRSCEKKAAIEKQIQNVEIQRHGVHAAIEKIEEEIKEVHVRKARKIKENEQLLLENLQLMKRGFDDDLDDIKAKYRQTIKGVVSSASLVTIDRLEYLETDNLSTHSSLCRELDMVLDEPIDRISVEAVSTIANLKKFQPADENILDIGTIQDQNRPLRVTKSVNPGGAVKGLTAMSEDTVAYSVQGTYNLYIIDSEGHVNLKSSSRSSQGHQFGDVAYVHGDEMNFLISLGNPKYAICAEDGVNKQLKDFPKPMGNYPCVSPSSQDGAIVVANGVNNICVFNSNDDTVIADIATEDKPMQAFETRSGVVIASTCDATNPGKVKVYDRKGNVGTSLTANQNEFLYAAVDNEDRVYIASINVNKYSLVLTQYRLVGTELKKVSQFEELTCVPSSWCYMVALSRNTLAFACYTTLYFIDIEPRID